MAEPAKKELAHVARIIALTRARDYGWLEGRSLEDIGTVLGVNRSTAMRNIRDIEMVNGLAGEYLEALAPRIPTKAPE